MSKKVNMKKVAASVVFAILSATVFHGWTNPSMAHTSSDGKGVAIEKARSSKDECRFDVFRDREWVTGEGMVVRVLKDDLRPPCHQRFLLADSRGNTLLIVNNIDDWPRLKGIAPGVAVAFKGEFIDNEKGGLVHWTHPDPTGRKSGGWLKIIDK